MKNIVNAVNRAFLVLVTLGAVPAFAADQTAPPPTTNASPAKTKDNVEFVIGPVYAWFVT